ncbi:hypothetical protein VPH35_041181 [Triticum aestivum]|nr:uncharacterized protein LOC123497282 [Aegilops tauschii subsp. strangulata]
MAPFIVIGLVLGLDLLAFVLAIGGELPRRADYVNVLVFDDDPERPFCLYGQGTEASTWYGPGAIVLLMAGQAVAMAATRCFCCGRPLSPGRWRSFSGLFFILSW